MHKEIQHFTKDKLVSQDRSQSNRNTISEPSPSFKISSQTSKTFASLTQIFCCFQLNLQLLA